jgi:hypothetical protein
MEISFILVTRTGSKIEDTQGTIPSDIGENGEGKGF